MEARGYLNKKPMAKRKNKTQTGPIVINDPDGPGLIKAIGKMSSRLLGKHWDTIQKFRGEGEENKLAVNLKVSIDYGPGEPALKVFIRYSQAVTDDASATVTDPNQGTFTEIEAESETNVPQPPSPAGDGDQPPAEEEPKEEKPRGRKKRETAKAE